VPIGHGFSFYGHEKSWKIHAEKEGAPWKPGRTRFGDPQVSLG